MCYVFQTKRGIGADGVLNKRAAKSGDTYWMYTFRAAVSSAFLLNLMSLCHGTLITPWYSTSRPGMDSWKTARLRFSGLVR